MSRFHNIWHNIIKNQIKASFVGFETVNNNLSLKIIKDKKTDYVDFKIPLQNIDSTIYENTLEDLKAHYEL